MIFRVAVGVILLLASGRADALLSEPIDDRIHAHICGGFGGIGMVSEYIQLLERRSWAPSAQLALDVGYSNVFGLELRADRSAGPHRGLTGTTPWLLVAELNPIFALVRPNRGRTFCPFVSVGFGTGAKYLDGMGQGYSKGTVGTIGVDLKLLARYSQVGISAEYRRITYGRFQAGTYVAERPFDANAFTVHVRAGLGVGFRPPW